MEQSAMKLMAKNKQLSTLSSQLIYGNNQSMVTRYVQQVLVWQQH